jgi:uncharacterized repeat protein (TIGR01451 family)
MKIERLCLSVTIGLSLMLALVWLLGSLMTAPLLAQSGTGVIRASTNGVDTPGCGSIAAPCQSVQYAVNQAVPGDEVLVATGTYTDPAGTVIALNKTVVVQGGWSSDFSVQDPALYPTTLDARRMGSVISITGQAGAPISPTIDGFIITQGDASSQAVKGGGLYSIYANPIVVNNVFTGNIANSVHYFTGDGGGLYLAQSPGVAVIRDNVFISNTAAITGGWGQGGAIYSEYSSALIVGNVISGNSANGFFAITDTSSFGGNGGGIVVYYGMTQTTVISGNQLYNNVASAGQNGTGGGMTLGDGPMLVQDNIVRGNAACVSGYGSGGGIFLSANRSPVTITGNLVQDNVAGMASIYDSRGGGIFLEYLLDPGPVVVHDNTVVSNTASMSGPGVGGGIYLRYGEGNTVIRDNQILSNTGSTASWAIGGGLYVAWSDAVTVAGNLIEGNRATIAPYPAVGGGGGIGTENNSSAILYRDNTIRGNVGALYGWAEAGGVYARNDNVVTFEDNLIEGNVGAFDQTAYGGGLYLERSAVTLRRNTIRNNRASTVDGFGGGLFTWYSGVTMDANTILSNAAAISTTGIGVGWGGGAAFFASIGVSFTNNLVAGNQAVSAGPSQGDGVWIRGSTIGELTVGTLLHNTVANNDGEGIWVGMYATATLTNNLVAGHAVAITNTAPASTSFDVGYTLFWNNGSVPISGSNPIVGDPAFVGGGDYHLNPGSAAIDAGIEAGVTRDIDGDPRPSGSGPDVGADEISLGLAKTAPGTAMSGEPITYTLIVTNTNPFTLTNLVVSDTVPAGAYYVSGGSYPGGDVSWTIPSLAPSGGAAQVSFVVTATATITNSQYRVVTSTEGVSTGFGPPVVTVIGAPPCYALTNVGIAGPLTGTLSNAYAFTATAGPPTATLPITYVWQATAQTPVTSTVYGITDAVQFTWNVTGTQTVTVTAANTCGIAVSDTHAVTVEAEPTVCPGPLTDVGISGPSSGYTGTLYTFTAVISPTDATEPITYTWSPEPISGQGAASAGYQWATPGVYTLTLAAENCGGAVGATHAITIEVESRYIYLPLIMRQYPPIGQTRHDDGALKGERPTPTRSPWRDALPPAPPHRPGLP